MITWEARFEMQSSQSPWNSAWEHGHTGRAGLVLPAAPSILACPALSCTSRASGTPGDSLVLQFQLHPQLPHPLAALMSMGVHIGGRVCSWGVRPKEDLHHHRPKWASDL